MPSPLSIKSGSTYSVGGVLAVTVICSAISFYAGLSFRSTIKNRHRRRFSNDQDGDKKDDSNFEVDESPSTPPASDEGIMDRPDLSLRLLRKAECCLRWRTDEILCVVERICDDHNYSAILRTVEALGVQHLWIIAPPTSINTMNSLEGNLDGDVLNDGVADDNDDNDCEDNTADKNSTSKSYLRRLSNESDLSASRSHFLYARRAAEWLTIREFQSTAECLDALRLDGRTVWATDLSQQAVPLTRDGIKAAFSSSYDTPGSVLPSRLAVVMGSESVGCSEAMLSAADARVYLPLCGMADSLNVSVASALVLQRLLDLSPNCRGGMDASFVKKLREEWYVKMATKRIITRKDKRVNARLVALSMAGEAIRKKCAKDPNYLPYQEELDKIQRCDEATVELVRRQNELVRKARESVAEFLENPVDPLGDMRRPDAHRISFCGKNTRRTNKDLWGNIATSKQLDTAVEPVSVSEEFRSRIASKTKQEEGEDS